jgi:hypothetical protein
MAKITWKLAAGKSWQDKLQREHPNHGKLVPVPERWRKRYGKGKLLIPRPLEIDALIRGVRKGRLVTQSQLREELAQRAGAVATCPLTTGIFLRIVAEAAAEEVTEGKKRVTPYWRVIKDDGGLNPKFPGGVRAQATRLRAEGFKIQPAKGKQPPRVEDFTASLIRL